MRTQMRQAKSNLMAVMELTRGLEFVLPRGKRIGRRQIQTLDGFAGYSQRRLQQFREQLKRRAA